MFVYPEAWKNIHRRKRPDVKEQNWTTCWTNTIEKGQIVEHYLLVVSDVLLLSFRETLELAIPACSARWGVGNP